MELHEWLEKNTKNVRDLLHHELSTLALAQALATSPKPDVLLHKIESMLYKRVVSIIEGVFDTLLAEIDLETALAYDTASIRTSIQLFVHTQVKDTCTDIKEKIAWWNKEH